MFDDAKNFLGNVNKLDSVWFQRIFIRGNLKRHDILKAFLYLSGASRRRREIHFTQMRGGEISKK